MAEYEDRTEDPTARRRQEARERGQAAISVDLTTAVALLGAVALLNWFGPGMLREMFVMLRDLESASEVRLDGLSIWLTRAALAAVAILTPFLLASFLIVAGGALLQTGALIAWSRVKPDLQNLSLARGLKRLFSLDSFVKLGQSLFKIVLIGWIAYYTIQHELMAMINSSTAAALSILTMAGAATVTLALRLALMLLILGLVDWFIQWRKHERGLRMTKQEVRDELRNMDGDPHMKARRRRIQNKLAMQRMAQDVPKADVVVTNPTEYAVALRYDEASMAAPRVIAKGRDYLALRIREIAAAHRVPIVQRPPLARAIYAAVDVGQEVPQQFYRAIAEVLAYVYKLSGKAAASA